MVLPFTANYACEPSSKCRELCRKQIRTKIVQLRINHHKVEGPQGKRIKPCDPKTTNDKQ
jgi:hypothetical protein